MGTIVCEKCLKDWLSSKVTVPLMEFSKDIVCLAFIPPFLSAELGLIRAKE